MSADQQVAAVADGGAQGGREILGVVEGVER